MPIMPGERGCAGEGPALLNLQWAWRDSASATAAEESHAKIKGIAAMKRESLLHLRTSREILTGLDVGRIQRPAPTMFQRMRSFIARGSKAITPHPNEAALAVELERERRRFKRRFQVVERSAGKILGFRQKLAATYEKHRRLMDLRLQLQRQYWQTTSPSHPQASQRATDGGSQEDLRRPRFRVRRLRYGGKP